MTKSQLVERIAQKAPQLQHHQVEAVVNVLFDSMMDSLKAHERIEIRGFGSFAVRARSARQGRNPKTGVKVQVPARHTLLFTVGKELRQKLNVSMETAPASPIPAPTPSRTQELGRRAEVADPIAAAAKTQPSLFMR